MSNLLSAGSRMLDRLLSTSLNDADDGTFTYFDGATQTSLPTVTMGFSADGDLSSNGIVRTWRRVDFLVPVDDIDGEPVVGQRIRWTRADGSEAFYEVLNSEEDGERCFRYSDDSTRSVYRIHTKEVTE